MHQNQHTLFGQRLIAGMLSFSDTLAVLGALGLGAMLDTVVRQPYKAKVSTWLSGLATRVGQVNYGGSKFLDRLFGRAIFSWRAVPRYAAISLISISLSYAFAMLSSPPYVMETIWIFKGPISVLDVLLLVVCFMGAMIGDVFSYAQTRLFVRAIDRTRSTVISAGLVAADIIVSMSIFFIMFSIARLICVLLVLQFHPAQTVSTTVSLEPGYLARALAEAGVEVKSDNQPMTAFAVAVANGRSHAQLEQVAAWQEKGVLSQLKDPASLRHVSFTATRRCVGRTDGERDQAGGAVVRTQDLFKAVMAEQARVRPITVEVDKINDRMALAYYSKLGELRRQPDNRCAFELTSMKASLTTRALVSAAGPFNAFSAAAERTIYDAYQVVGFKLAPYVGFDPYATMPSYFDSLEIQLQNSFLGAFPIDPDRAALATYFTDPVKAVPGQVNIPFSPMVASSLTTSAFLVIYLATIVLAAFRATLAATVQRLLPAIDLEKSVFTSISVALVVLVVCVSGGLWVFQAIWRLLLGYW